MAYSYNDFISEAKKANALNRLTQQDLVTAQNDPNYGRSMLRLIQDSTSANTAEKRLLANEAANVLRNSVGSSFAAGDLVRLEPRLSVAGGSGTGGTGQDSSGSGTVSAGQDSIGSVAGAKAESQQEKSAWAALQELVNSYGSFSYDNQSTYDKLLSQIAGYGPYSYRNESAYQKLLQSIINQEDFSYDLESDPLWASYSKQYLREGERAAANALAQASAASGGRVSSWAQTAAQQANNYYAAQLGDMIPALQQLAYEQYLSELASDLERLSAIGEDRAFDYQTYLDRFNQLQSSLGTVQGDMEADYAQWANGLESLLAQQEQQYNNALALYETLGYATPEVAEILGVEAYNGNDLTDIENDTENEDGEETVDQASLSSAMKATGASTVAELEDAINAGYVMVKKVGNTWYYELTNNGSSDTTAKKWGR